MNLLHFTVIFQLLLLTSFSQCKDSVYTEDRSSDNMLEELLFGINSDAESLLEEGVDFSKFNVTHLLEVQFINKSLNHYQSKAEQVHLSLQSRVKHLLNFRQHSSTVLSPLNSVEFKQKLNATLTGLFTTLDLSPICWTSLNIIRSDLTQKKLWPLKCNFVTLIISFD